MNSFRDIDVSQDYSMLSKLKVLIVDESSLLIQSIRGMLSKLKFDEKNIQHAYDTKLASWLLNCKGDKCTKYDVIICSYSFRNKPGVKDFFHFLESENLRSHLTAVIVTDNALDISTIRSIDTFMPDGFIAKPFNYNYFESQVKQTLLRAFQLKTLRNTFFSQNYSKVLELADELATKYPQQLDAIQRVKSMALAKLKRYDEAILTCESLLKGNSEWAAVNLVEYYSLTNRESKISELVAKRPEVATHPTVTRILEEMGLQTNSYETLVSKYSKAENDYEQQIKSCLLPLYQLDYDAVVARLTDFTRANRNNPLLDVRCVLFLRVLNNLSQTLGSSHKSSFQKEEEFSIVLNKNQHSAYNELIQVLNSHSNKDLFETQKRLEEVKNLVLNAQDNLLLLVYISTCFKLGLDEHVIATNKTINQYIDNNYLSVIVAKLINRLAKQSQEHITNCNKGFTKDFTTLKNNTMLFPLNRSYHELLVDKAATLASTTNGNLAQRLCIEIEHSIIYLKNLYVYNKNKAGLETLKASYLTIKMQSTQATV